MEPGRPWLASGTRWLHPLEAFPCSTARANRMLSPSTVAFTAPVQAAVDASAREGLGAFAEPGGTRFRAFATAATGCSVRLFDGQGKVLGTHAMQAQGGGFFELTLPGVEPGALYKLVLRGAGQEKERELPDPYARFLPQGVHGPAQV